MSDSVIKFLSNQAGRQGGKRKKEGGADIRTF